MLIRTRNPQIPAQEVSAVAQDVDAGSTSLVVLNTTGFSSGQFIVINKLGQEQAELRRIDSTSGGNNVRLVTALSFSHSPGSQIFNIEYDQVEISRKLTASSAWSVLTTVNLQVDDDFTTYDDVSGQTSFFYRTRFLNSYSGQYSDYSATRAGTGPSTKEVSKMIDMVLRRAEDPKGEYTTRPEVLDDINSGYQEIINAINQSSSGYYRKVIEIPTLSYTYEYSLPDDFKEIQEVRDSDTNMVPPSPRNVIFQSEPGYELTGLNTIYFNDIPTPSQDQTVPITVLANNSYDENGTWVASNDASNVTTDLDTFKTGVGSTNFDTSAASANKGTITNSTFTAIDFTDYLSTGKFRIWFYIPDVTYVTSFDLRWGTDSSNYYALNITTDYKSHNFITGWNLLEFNWSSTSVTTTGTPTITSIGYLQLGVNYSARQAALTDWRLDNISLANAYNTNSVYEVTYLYQPPQLTNEMDELEIPPGNQYLLVDYAVAQILMRKGERDTLAQKLLDNFNQKIGKFISQSAKRTRRPIGMRPYGRKRKYFSRNAGTPLVSNNTDMIVRKI